MRNWRQDTPRQQMAVVLQSVLGNLINAEDGTIDPKTALARVRDGVDEVFEVLQYVRDHEWPEEAKKHR